LSQERPHDIEVKYRDPKTQETKSFKMRVGQWLDEESRLLRFADATGKLSQKEIWKSRILDMVEGMNDDAFKTMSSFMMEIYMTKWNQYNTVNVESFLEVSTTKQSS